MWISLILLIPVIDAFGNLFSKQASRGGTDPLLISWSNNILTVLLLFPSVFLVKYDLNSGYFGALAVTGTFNVIATAMSMYAISLGELSKVIPMLSFTPLFMLISSPVIVGEMPKPLGVTGIFLVVIGSYFLNVNLRSGDLLYPIRALFRDKGTRIMLAVAFIYSITSNFDKVALNHCHSPLQHAFFLNVFVFTGITILISLLKRFKFKPIIAQRTNLFLLSLMNMAGTVLFMLAISVTYVAYIIAVKRTSGMLSVIIGHYVLKEPNIRERILGAAIMFSGVALIIFS